MQVLEKAYVQTAVYWGNPVTDGLGGYTYDSPIEVKCRWEQKQEVITEQKGPGAHGEEIISTAQIYVLQDMSEGEVLYLGSKDEFSDVVWDDGTTWDDARIWAEAPNAIENAFKIKKFEKTPVYRSTSNFLRKVYL